MVVTLEIEAITMVVSATKNMMAASKKAALKETLANMLVSPEAAQ